MNCRLAQSRLSAYIDGELDGREMLAVREHVGLCNCCRGELEELRSLKALLVRCSAPEPRLEFEDRLLATVFSHSERRTRANWRATLFASLGTAAAAMAVTTVWLQSHREPTASPIRAKDDIALELGRDQIAQAASDPLSGAGAGTPVFYAGR